MQWSCCFRNRHCTFLQTTYISALNDSYQTDMCWLLVKLRHKKCLARGRNRCFSWKSVVLLLQRRMQNELTSQTLWWLPQRQLPSFSMSNDIPSASAAVCVYTPISPTFKTPWIHFCLHVDTWKSILCLCVDTWKSIIVSMTTVPFLSPIYHSNKQRLCLNPPMWFTACSQSV